MMEVRMARRKLTAEEMAAKVAKMKATKAAKKAAALETLGLSQYDRAPAKTRKKRKLSAAQKKAAADRLAKARAAKGPPQNMQIHEDVRNLPADHVLSYKNVKSWQTENKQLLASIKSFKDSKDVKERMKYQSVDCYIQNIGSYLRNGVWLDSFYGSQQQHRIKHRCVAMAYYPDGTPKRTVGVWYPDIGTEWTKEMELDRD